MKHEQEYSCLLYTSKGYTQSKLARFSGVGINFVSNLENGKETSELGKTLRVLQTLGMDLSADSRDA